MSSSSSSPAAAALPAQSARLVRVAATAASCPIPDCIPIGRGDTLLFGRNKGANVFLDSKIMPNMISRSHAKVVCCASTGRVTLVDLDSTNGVFVNDRKVDYATLRRGDRVTFGGRGKSVRVGQVDPQPNSEFIYEFQADDDAEEDAEDADGEEDSEPSAAAGAAGAFALLRELTDHVQLLVTWVTAAVVAGSYLFAEEGSDEWSFARDCAAPLFTLLRVPFTRLTFTLAVVVAGAALLAAGIAIVKASRGHKNNKKQRRKQKDA